MLKLRGEPLVHEFGSRILLHIDRIFVIQKKIRHFLPVLRKLSQGYVNSLLSYEMIKYHNIRIKNCFTGNALRVNPFKDFSWKNVFKNSFRLDASTQQSDWIKFCNICYLLEILFLIIYPFDLGVWIRSRCFPCAFINLK